MISPLMILAVMTSDTNHQLLDNPTGDTDTTGDTITRVNTISTASCDTTTRDTTTGNTTTGNTTTDGISYHD